MSGEYSPSSCDYCDQQLCCSNIYVAMKIVESELNHCRSEELKARYSEILQEITASGYQYPNSRSTCEMTADDQRAIALLASLRSILVDIRIHIKDGVVKVS